MRAVIAVLLLLAACGRKGELEPKPGVGMPPPPRGEGVAPTPDQMLVLPPQAAPDRAGDPVRSNDERKDDRFNLPPPGG